MELDEQIALHALGALEPAERAELARLAAASPAVRKRIAEECALTRALAEAPEPVAPSAAVFKRLLTQIEAQETPLRQRLDAASRDQQRARVRAESTPTALLRGLLFGLGAVSAAALVIVSINLIQTQNLLAALRQEASTTRTQLREARDALAAQQKSVTEKDAQIDALTQARAELDTQIAAARTALETAQNDITAARGDARRSADALKTAQTDLEQLQNELAILGSATAQRAVLPASSAPYQTGVVSVVFAADQKSGIVTVANLPPLPDNQCYQLWLIDGDNPLPSVVIKTDANGNGRALVPSDVAFGNYELFGVTVEKAGGSPTPNPDGPIYLGKAG